MNLEDMIETVRVFSKYPSAFDGVAGAEHDEIYASLNPEEVSEEDMEALDKIGWFVGADGFMKFV